MVGARRIRRRTVEQAAAALTYRATVLAVVLAADAQLTGREVAQLAGMPYRRAIDALVALYNSGRVARAGRKYTARWHAPTAPGNPAAELEAAFAAWMKKQ